MMLRKRRTKQRRDEVSTNDSLPLLEKLGRGKESAREEKGFQWDKDPIIAEPKVSAKGKKLTIKVKNISRQPLVVRHKFPHTNVNTSMDIASIAPRQTSSTESDNSVAEVQSSERNLRRIYSEKRSERKILDRKKPNNKNHMETKEEGSRSNENAIVSPHGFHVSPGEDLESSYLQDFFTQRSARGLSNDKDWMKIVDDGSIVSCATQKVDADCNGEDSFNYHDLISEAVVLRLKNDRTKKKNAIKNNSPMYCNTSVMSESSMTADSKHSYSTTLNKKQSHDTLDFSKHTIVEQRQPKVEAHRFYQGVSAKTASEFQSDTTKGTPSKSFLLHNMNTTDDMKKVTPKPTLKVQPKERTEKLTKPYQEKIDSSTYGFVKSGGRRPSKAAAPQLVNDSCDKFTQTGSGFFNREISTQNEIQEERVAKVTSPYELETADTSLVSICLLNLNGNKTDVSSRLKSGFITSGRRNSQSDREYLQRMGCTDEYGYIVLENIRSFGSENEEVQLWKTMVPIDKDGNESRAGYEKEQFQLGRSRDAKSQIATLLMVRKVCLRSLVVVRSENIFLLTLSFLPSQNGDFNKATEFLHDNMQMDRAHSGVFTWMNIGSIQLWQGNYADALASFEAATEDMDGNTSRQARSLALLGMALYGHMKFEEANQAYLRALTMLRTKTKQGYGCYNHRHDFVMGQIFNCVGCSFYETGFHKSATRSFLNALHVYLQDIFTSSLTAEESQSVEFLLKTVKVNKTWMSHIPPPFILDTAITFANLAFVLTNRNHLALAISCLRLSLKVGLSRFFIASLFLFSVI